MAVEYPWRVGYDAQAFIAPNRGSGKGLQLRNLIGPYAHNFVGFAPPGPETPDIPLIRAGSQNYTLWQQRDLPRMIRAANLDIFLAPYNTAPVLLPRKTKLVLVLHDLIPFERFPHSSPRLAWHLFVWRTLIRRSVPRAHVVLTVSEFSRREILHRFPRANVQVVPCTIPESWFDPDAFVPIADRGNYLLLVSSTEPHRNLHRFFQAYAGYVDRQGEHAADLRVAGVSRRAAFLRQVLVDLKISSKVTLEPYLPDSAIQHLVRNAKAVCLPSLAEGFGIPILEAMSAGTPVICSNVTSMPEVGMEAPEYFDPYSVDSITDAIARVTASTDLQKEMSRRGLLRAQAFHPQTVSGRIQEFWESLGRSLSPAVDRGLGSTTV